MRPALLLIDLQNDFLNSPGLEPARGHVVEKSAQLLRHFRAQRLPVVHIWTTADQERRMPHWKTAGKLICVDGTNGHSPPNELAPLASETVVHKTYFSGFSNAELPELLRALEVDTLLLAGVHLHACIRSTVLDAYQEGFASVVAEDAVGSDDPLHAAVTRRYLEARATAFHPVEKLCSSVMGEARPFESPSNGQSSAEILHYSPRQTDRLLWKMPVTTAQQIGRCAEAAGESVRLWNSVSINERLAVINRIADIFEGAAAELASQIALEVGKPISYAREEVARSVTLLRALPSYVQNGAETPCGKDISVRYRPLGTVALITPWNNPIAIPLGKIGPALLYGNAVVWKPAPAASSIAVKMMDLFRRANIPENLIELVVGDRSTAIGVMTHPGIDAVSLSGSLAAGYAAQDICSRRHIPLQGELGGNNPSIVWSDCDLKTAAEKVAESAFGFSGQRCTANRRAIVEAPCYERFLHLLEEATANLVWGDPLDDRTRVGPVITRAKCKDLTSLVARARESAQFVRTPHCENAGPPEAGAYFPPTIVGCEDPNAEIVQEESFGPILVVQRATTWANAMELCNGVKQGLVASIFSESRDIQATFLEQAHFGILKINSGTANASAEAPFGGWGASGIGPPEHGSANREFYTRTQSVYR